MRSFFKPTTVEEVSDDALDIENGDVDYISSDSDEEFDNFEESNDEEQTDSESEDDEAGASGDTKPLVDLNEEEEEDETVRAMIAAIKKPRSVPPEILTDDYVTDISFHPNQDIIAIATILGDILLYKYANEENTLIKSVEVHTKACRDIEFSTDGKVLISGSKDKSIMLTDMETGKLRKFYDNAHNDTINKLYVMDEYLFASGDDSGMVKLWDQRTNEPIFALKEVEDYISGMLTNDAKKLLLITSGDGYLTTINLGSRKLFVQSEPYSEELTCMGLYRGDSKVVVGTSKGRIYTYNWGEFGYHCDMFPGLKSPISRMIPITDRIGCMGGEDGIIRATHIAPFRNLGIVGQHSLPVESMDISHSGELIATSSHNNDIRFWNIKYFEDFQDIKYNEKHNSYRERQHNLPSSKYSNSTDFFADLNKGDVD